MTLPTRFSVIICAFIFTIGVFSYCGEPVNNDGLEPRKKADVNYDLLYKKAMNPLRLAIAHSLLYPEADASKELWEQQFDTIINMRMDCIKDAAFVAKKTKNSDRYLKLARMLFSDLINSSNKSSHDIFGELIGFAMSWPGSESVSTQDMKSEILQMWEKTAPKLSDIHIRLLIASGSGYYSARLARLINYLEQYKALFQIKSEIDLTINNQNTMRKRIADFLSDNGRSQTDAEINDLLTAFKRLYFHLGQFYATHHRNMESLEVFITFESIFIKSKRYSTLGVVSDGDVFYHICQAFDRIIKNSEEPDKNMLEKALGYCQKYLSIDGDRKHEAEISAIQAAINAMINNAQQ